MPCIQPMALNGTRSRVAPLSALPRRAVGIVTTFADAPFSTPELEALLLAGGEFHVACGRTGKRFEPLPRHRRQLGVGAEAGRDTGLGAEAETGGREGLEFLELIDCSIS
jgi:hypothetical protein